jgi:hypothetical protein
MDWKREYYVLMAHFAELDNNNIVKQVIVVHNNELLDESGNESEQKGIDFCTNLFGGQWVQTSYNSAIRKKYAGIGYTYDPIANHFFAPQPYPSWTLDADANWQPPTPMPVEEGKIFIWNEDILNWEEIQASE